MSVVEAPPPQRPSREVLGPSARGDDPRRLFRLAYTLAATDFKLKFFGSVLGYVWQLMNPLLLFGVLFLVFSLALKLTEGVEYYPVALLLGIVLYGFFNEATTSAVRSLMTREPLVRKVEFPRLAVPMASVLTATFNLGLNLIPVLIFLLIEGDRPRPAWFAFLGVIVLLVLFAFGMAMLLSVGFVRFRDIEPIWTVILQIAFYASFVFFSVQQIGGGKHGQLLIDILFCNPFATLLGYARHFFVDPSWVAPGSAVSSPWLMVIPFGLIVVSVVGGYFVFAREAPRVAEDL